MPCTGMLPPDRKTRQFVDLPASDCGFSYRRSIFNSSQRDRYVVSRVDYALHRNAPARSENQTICGSPRLGLRVLLSPEHLQQQPARPLRSEPRRLCLAPECSRQIGKPDNLWISPPRIAGSLIAGASSTAASETVT